MKNYIGFVNDHSGSMSRLATAAAIDYNANIAAVKDAASREMLDTVVSVVGVGLREGVDEVKRQVVISNPHVLKPITNWPCPGGTPLYDGIGSMIELFESLPDADNQDVSFLVMVTTDGEEAHSRTGWKDKAYLRSRIVGLQNTGRWTFVMRVPKGHTRSVNDLGIPSGNIVEWETSSEGMARSTAQTQTAVNSYYTARSSGAKSSTVFYTNAAGVNTSSLKELDPKEFSLYVVPNDKQGVMVSEFILSKRMEYLKGGAFYQLTKTEARVSPSKLILVRDRASGKVYAGNEARQMIGLPTTSNARLHPGDHGNYDIFIQSESWNRKLVAGTGVIYWAKQGTPFTAEDLAKFAPKSAVQAPAVVQLPAVPVTNKPTPSPIPVAKAPVAKTAAPMVNGRHVKVYATRDLARSNHSCGVQDAWEVLGHGVEFMGDIYRWFVYA